MHHCHGQDGTYRRMEALLLLDRGAPLQMVARAYGILPAELLYLQKNREVLKSCNFHWTWELERQLYLWYIATQCRQFVSDRMIQWKAMEFYYSATGTWGQPPSQTWLKSWKDRHGIVSMIQR